MAKLLEQVGPMSIELGYVDELDLPQLGGDERLCFSRKGEFFNLEAICWIYKRRPSRILMVDFLGSPLSPSELQRQGPIGNCLAESLFQGQVSLLRRDPATILPAAIELGEPGHWSEVVSRLVGEVRAVEAEIWPRMRDKWNRLTSRPSIATKAT